MSVYLLDTHVFLWGLSDRSRLSPETRAILEDPRDETRLSVASSWEIGIKYAAGKLQLPEPPSVFLPDRLDLTATSLVSITQHHVLRAAELPAHHKDPFDRVIVAQAQTLGIPLITADAAVKRYDVEIIDA